MTTDEGFPEAGYLQWGIPGVPYSAVRIPLVYDANQMHVLIMQAIEAAQMLRAAYGDEFGAQPQASTQPQAQEARARRGTGWICPEHNVEVFESSPQYQTYDLDEHGNEIPAKFYHPLAEPHRSPDGRLVKNHNLYRSQLVRG